MADSRSYGLVQKKASKAEDPKAREAKELEEMALLEKAAREAAEAREAEAAASKAAAEEATSSGAADAAGAANEPPPPPKTKPMRWRERKEAEELAKQAEAGEAAVNRLKKRSGLSTKSEANAETRALEDQKAELSQQMERLSETKQRLSENEHRQHHAEISAQEARERHRHLMKQVAARKEQPDTDAAMMKRLQQMSLRMQENSEDQGHVARFNSHPSLLSHTGPLIGSSAPPPQGDTSPPARAFPHQDEALRRFWRDQSRQRASASHDLDDIDAQTGSRLLEEDLSSDQQFGGGIMEGMHGKARIDAIQYAAMNGSAHVQQRHNSPHSPDHQPTSHEDLTAPAQSEDPYSLQDLDVCLVDEEFWSRPAPQQLLQQLPEKQLSSLLKQQHALPPEHQSLEEMSSDRAFHQHIDWDLADDQLDSEAAYQNAMQQMPAEPAYAGLPDDVRESWGQYQQGMQAQMPAEPACGDLPHDVREAWGLLQEGLSEQGSTVLRQSGLQRNADVSQEAHQDAMHEQLVAEPQRRPMQWPMRRAACKPVRRKSTQSTRQGRRHVRRVLETGSESEYDRDEAGHAPPSPQQSRRFVFPDAPAGPPNQQNDLENDLKFTWERRSDFGDQPGHAHSQSGAMSPSQWDHHPGTRQPACPAPLMRKAHHPLEASSDQAGQQLQGAASRGFPGAVSSQTGSDDDLRDGLDYCSSDDTTWEDAQPLSAFQAVLQTLETRLLGDQMSVHVDRALDMLFQLLEQNYYPELTALVQAWHTCPNPEKKEWFLEQIKAEFAALMDAAEIDPHQHSPDQNSPPRYQCQLDSDLSPSPDAKQLPGQLPQHASRPHITQQQLQMGSRANVYAAHNGVSPPALGQHEARHARKSTSASDPRYGDMRAYEDQQGVIPTDPVRSAPPTPATVTSVTMPCAACSSCERGDRTDTGRHLAEHSHADAVRHMEADAQGGHDPRLRGHRHLESMRSADLDSDQASTVPMSEEDCHVPDSGHSSDEARNGLSSEHLGQIPLLACLPVEPEAFRLFACTFAGRVDGLVQMASPLASEIFKRHLERFRKEERPSQSDIDGYLERGFGKGALEQAMPALIQLGKVSDLVRRVHLQPQMLARLMRDVPEFYPHWANQLKNALDELARAAADQEWQPLQVLHMLDSWSNGLRDACVLREKLAAHVEKTVQDSSQ